jgi:hypothetical protein
MTTWHEALKAIAEDARGRRDNTRPSPCSDRDGRTFEDGARYAFDVMAREADYLAEGGREHTQRIVALLERRLRRAIADQAKQGKE